MKKQLPIIIILFSLLLVIPSYVRAQVTSAKMTVAPSRQELTIDPGETTAINIKFLNQTDSPISGLLKVADFIVENKEGTPTFLEESPTVTGVTQISPRFSAASWITLPYDRMTIAAKDKVLINAKITAPANARPGGRYVAIYFEPGGTPTKAAGLPKEAASPVAVKIAGLVYMRVSGPVSEDAWVIQFTAPRFSQYGPVNITTELANKGDYHIRPKGTITLTNILGKEIDSQLLKEENIFPDASRLFENKLGQKWMLGKYGAKLTAVYGETGKALTATIYFWVFPWKEVTIAILAIVISIILLSTFFRRFKHRQEELEEKVEELEKKLEEKPSGE